jgi:hypothetical protein
VRLWGPRYPVLRRVVVNTKTNQTAFRGLLWGRRGGYLILREAEMLAPRAAPARLDGEVLVPEENVDFLQVVG